MKNPLSVIIIFLIFNTSFAQKNQTESFENYDFYVEKNIEMGKWSKKFHLKNGLIITDESYWKNELRRKTILEYDKFCNVNREAEIYNINDGKVNIVTQIKLEYENGLLIGKKFDYGLTEKYSDFDKSGNPRLIERIDEHNIWSHNEILNYDENGNLVKSIVFSTHKDLNNETVKEKAITHFKYDKWNNVIEIYRKFEPKQEFPIIMTGGPAKYEFEYFRYKYKKNGLWTKKYKTVNGKEILVAKRKYK